MVEYLKALRYLNRHFSALLMLLWAVLTLVSHPNKATCFAPLHFSLDLFGSLIAPVKVRSSGIKDKATSQLAQKGEVTRLRCNPHKQPPK